MESNNNISSPEEVLEYIDNHNNKANLMIDEGHDIIEQIKKMNQEISSEIKTQNVIIDNLSNNINKGQKLSDDGLSKLDKMLVKTSTTKQIVFMIIQSVIILFLLLI